jgi:hypothetical protein
MTTTAARRAIHEAVACDIRRCSEAPARAAHQGNGWQADALERAGELALSGRLAESREAARKGQESRTMTATPAPTIITRIGEYDPATRQYPAYVAIDGEPEQLVGYAWSAGAADRLCDEFVFNYYTDNHTPEVAAQIALALASAEPETHCPDCGDPLYLPNGSDCCSCGTSAMAVTPIEPAPQVVDERLPSGFCCGACQASDYGPSRMQPTICYECIRAWLGGYSSRFDPPYLALRQASAASEPEPIVVATRYVSIGWDGRTHPDLAVIAAQVLLPLAHLAPSVSNSGNYVIATARDVIEAPPSDHAIVCDLIDTLNAVAAQLPARPDSITATLHVGTEFYSVQHNGPPRWTQSRCVTNANGRPDAGAAIVRQWTTDRGYFLKVLGHMEPVDIYQMARAAVAHCATSVPWAPVTIDQMLAAWQHAARQGAADGAELSHGSSTTM